MGSHESGVKGAIRYATEMINARGKINFDHEGWKRFPHQAQYILEQGIFRKWTAEDLEVTSNSSVPTCFSSALICWLRVGWLIFSLRAARQKCRC